MFEKRNRGLFYCLVNAILLSVMLYAQQPGEGIVTGEVFNESTDKPIEFASVGLFKLPDSSLVAGTMTDAEGKYFIEKVPDGKYYLLVNRIGYESSKPITLVIDTQNKKADLGKLNLVEIPVPAGDIAVTAEKPVYENTIDRKIYNVEQDIMSKSGTVSDLLQNVPSVTVDIDGNISLRGSENVLVLINGRSSPLMGKNRAAVLQQMPAGSIEKIEVITNPSAKYKPEGTSGIINIVLKKNTIAGLNGSIALNGGYDTRYNGNITLNYNPGHFNIYGSLGYRKDSRSRHSLNSRRFYDQNGQIDNYLDENGQTHARPLSYISSLGIDYNLGESDHFGVSGNYFYRDVRQRGVTSYTSQDDNLSIISDYIRGRDAVEHEFENEGRVYYEHSFAKEDHKLHIEYNISDQPEKETNHYVDTYSIPALQSQYENDEQSR